MPPSLYSIHHINHYYITEGGLQPTPEHLFKTRWGNSLVAQWLTLHASNAGGCRFNPWLEN